MNPFGTMNVHFEFIHHAFFRHFLYIDFTMRRDIAKIYVLLVVWFRVIFEKH